MRTPLHTSAPLNPRDLEAIVTMLEVAGLTLTETPGQTFTREALFREANALIGPKVRIDESDMAIVLKGMKTFRNVGGELCVR